MEPNENLVDGKAQESIDASTRKAAVISTGLSITSLPPELHLKIFDEAHCEVCSTCLGLTCKAFYAIHRAKHGKVDILSRCDPSKSNPATRRRLSTIGIRVKIHYDRLNHENDLHGRLKQWMLPRVFKILGPGKLVTPERRNKLVGNLERWIENRKRKRRPGSG